MKINPLTAIDFYKADHRRQYPEGTTLVYSNFTARWDGFAKVIPGMYDHKVVFFGLQYFIKDFLIDTWNEGFFNQPKEEVVKAYKERMDNALGMDAIDVSHIEELHDLGYLPLRIKALPEGACVPISIPLLTVVNTLPQFFWLTNYIESAMSAYLWKPITSATTAFQYKKLLTDYAIRTGTPLGLVDIQAHDFSFRGMSGIEDAAMSGAGHLTSFVGTDSVPAIDFVEQYYNAHPRTEMVGCSVPATEHSVMCMGGKENEIVTFERLINETYPTGIVSIVSDSWDFWKVITEYLPLLKDKIMKRNGKVVIRPDSGDPVKIICGDPDGKTLPERKGAVQCLWEIFGGTRQTNGSYCLLDSHIGLIYGDSITLDVANRILEGLRKKAFASGNVVLGVGSFTYQYVTRDSFGFAMKATYGEVDGEPRVIFKDPKTGSGKKSAKGLLRVEIEEGEYKLIENVSKAQELGGELKTVFINGILQHDITLAEIRMRLKVELNEYKGT